MSAVLRSMDASFEEAAIMAGASPLHAFWSITLRMGIPAICALAMLIFVRTFESFEVPALVGLAGNINVLTTTIYQSARRTGAPNYGEFGRLFDLPHPDRDAAADLAEPPRASRAPLPDDHRKGFPAAHRRSRRVAIS